jgi:RHS repeat-associated protein
MTHTIGDGATSLTLTYDSEHARITQLLTAASTTTTTNYLNDPISGAMGEKVVSGSTSTWNDYLLVDGRPVGERTSTAGATTWQFFILDHLGSVAVVTDGTMGSSTLGQVTARESFDAWSKQRNSDWSDNPTCSAGLASPTTKGFTGQEDIASLCLVNLNARLYDPNIGRFLSADSVVADLTDPQAYNRYTYVNNRPLSLTDPTGHLAGDLGSNCIGACGNWNPGSQADGSDASAHPKCRCWATSRSAYPATSQTVSQAYTSHTTPAAKLLKAKTRRKMKSRLREITAQTIARPPLTASPCTCSTRHRQTRQQQRNPNGYIL